MYITYHSRFIPEAGNREISDPPRDKFFQNYLGMRNTADVVEIQRKTGGKPRLQTISGVSVVNPLMVFYDIVYFVLDTTRDLKK
jgi:hypothetical protein